MKSNEIKKLDIPEEEIEVLLTLRNRTNKLRLLDEMEWDSVGFRIEENHVVDLNLYKCQFQRIPESIGNLNNLISLNFFIILE